MTGLWIFGYGSLMWKPGFAYDRARRATLRGYSRAFCIYSVHHRGTARRPGLVLGLDRGGVCEGVAFHVPGPQVAETLAYLRIREQVTGVYREAVCPIRLHSGAKEDEPDAGQAGGETRALAYLVERAHPQYAGRLPLESQARLIRHAVGISGRNLDYLVSTLAHLRDLGIAEPELERVSNIAGGHRRRPAPSPSHTHVAAHSGVLGNGLLPFGPKLNADLMHRFMYRRNLMLRAAAG